MITVKKFVEAGRDYVTRASYSTWWKCGAGSRPFFCRFLEAFRLDTMKGNQTWIKKGLPSYRRKTKKIKDLDAKEKLKDKITKLRKYGYVALGVVTSVMDVFTVPKIDGIRPV